MMCNCYEGEAEYILSNKIMVENKVVGKGKVVYIKGIEYILVQDIKLGEENYEDIKKVR